MLNWFLKKINNRKGFTLIELIVVVAILGILALIAVPRFVDVTNTSRVSAAMSNHKVAIAAVELARAESGGSLPATDITSLNSYIEGGAAALNASGSTSTWTVSGTPATGSLVTVVGFRSSKYPAGTQGNVVITLTGTNDTTFTTDFN